MNNAIAMVTSNVIKALLCPDIFKPNIRMKSNTIGIIAINALIIYILKV